MMAVGFCHIMEDLDYFRMGAGEKMDGIIHVHLFGETREGAIPSYSSEDQFAEKVLVKLRKKFKKTSRSHFEAGHGSGEYCYARFGTSRSIKDVSVEVHCKGLALAVCRMAALRLWIAYSEKKERREKKYQPRATRE